MKNNISWKSFTTKLVYTFLAVILIGAATNCGGTRKANQQKKSIKSDSISIENKLILRQNVVLRDIGSIQAFDNFEIQADHKKLEVGKEEIVKEKQIDKTNNTFLYLGFVFIPLFFIFLYFYLPTLRYDLKTLKNKIMK